MSVLLDLISDLNPAFLVISSLIIGGVLFSIFNNIFVMVIGFVISISCTMIILYYQQKKAQHKNQSVRSEP